MEKLPEGFEKDINEQLARLCGWKEGYVRRAGTLLAAGGWLVPATENEHGAVKGWIKKELLRPTRAKIHCPVYTDGSRMEELLVALGHENYKVQLMTNPHVAVVKSGTSDKKSAFSWDANAIYAPDNPGRALAFSAYAAIREAVAES